MKREENKEDVEAGGRKEVGENGGEEPEGRWAIDARI